MLALDRIRELHEAIPAALVLHGGSGVPDEQIVAGVKAGIRKINFGTDVCCSFLDAAREVDKSIIVFEGGKANEYWGNYDEYKASISAESKGNGNERKKGK